MNRIALSLAACLTFASLGHAEVRPIIIDEDEGGRVDTFLMWYGRVRDSGVPVQVRGLCGSACTLVFNLPREQLCAESTASFGFHLFSYNGEPNPTATEAYMRRYYPAALFNYIKANNIPVKDYLYYVSGAKLIEAGVIRACEVGGAK